MKAPSKVPLNLIAVMLMISGNLELCRTNIMFAAHSNRYFMDAGEWVNHEQKNPHIKH
jgi:hypothetical protein